MIAITKATIDKIIATRLSTLPVAPPWRACACACERGVDLGVGERRVFGCLLGLAFAFTNVLGNTVIRQGYGEVREL